LDGLKIPIQKPADEETQNAHCNGWLHDHFVGCVFAFVPSGLVVACTVNGPGSWHDSFIAENVGIYAKLESVYETTGEKAAVDSAFLLKRWQFLIKSGKKKHRKTTLEKRNRHQATFLRQSAEWGMKALHGSFPMLKDLIIYFDDMADCKVFLNSIPMIYNFRTMFFGLNQIRSTSYPIFELNGDCAFNIFD
jgi:hypothetical protein